MADQGTNVHNKNDFISREAMRKANQDEWEGVCGDYDGHQIFIDNENMIDSIPAADVRPVVRAFWVGKMEGVGICSNCKRLDHIDPLATHCRYCGADMREPQMLKNASQNADNDVMMPAT